MNALDQSNWTCHRSSVAVGKTHHEHAPRLPWYSTSEAIMIAGVHDDTARCR